jgi:hypothetical protein
MSPAEKSKYIADHGQAAFLTLPWDEAAAAQQTPARDDKGRFRAGVRRSQMSNQEKAAYIGAHGQDAFLSLPA